MKNFQFLFNSMSPFSTKKVSGSEVGDYDKSNLYETAQAEYRNIAKEFVKEYNEFIGKDDYKLDAARA